jgi:hypothetical protein
MGCTNDPTESSEDVRARYVDRHADTFPLTDRAKAMDALKDVLAEEGYELVATTSENKWKTSLKHRYKSTEELSITLIVLVDASLILQIFEITRNEKTTEVESRKQRLDLEWVVVQRAEPDRALALKRKANDRADKVPPITRKK